LRSWAAIPVLVAAVSALAMPVNSQERLRRHVRRRELLYRPGGAFYSIDMLPPLWQKITLFNPVVHLVSGMRWSFYGVADVDVAVSVAMTLVFLALCMAAVLWIFRTGYKLRN
jgi:hypothetical protein